jgi:hypothetical protein
VGHLRQLQARSKQAVDTTRGRPVREDVRRVCPLPRIWNLTRPNPSSSAPRPGGRALEKQRTLPLALVAFKANASESSQYALRSGSVRARRRGWGAPRPAWLVQCFSLSYLSKCAAGLRPALALRSIRACDACL